MKIADIKAQNDEEILEEQELREAFLDKGRLTVYGIDPSEVNNFEEFSDLVRRQKRVNPGLHRKIMSMD